MKKVMVYMETEKKPKMSRLKFILMIVIPTVLIISISLGYMVMAGKNFSDVRKVFEKEEEEFTIPLDEFLVNINSSTGKSRYLKIKLALMYTEKKHGEILIVNVSRIRDLIISDLRAMETDELLDPKGTKDMKSKILKNINTSLDKNIVKEVYITDLIVQ